MLDTKVNFAAKNSNKIRSAFGISGIVFVFIAVTFVNQKTVNQVDQSSIVADGRNVASVASMQNNVLHDSAWKKNLASRLAEMSKVPGGKIARQASAIENFVFGELKGYYLMELRGEKVSEMFLKQKEAADAPRYLGEEFSFLENNKQFWWINFSNLELKERTSEKSVIKLLDSGRKVVGEASFSWDSSGRLLSLKLDQAQ